MQSTSKSKQIKAHFIIVISIKQGTTEKKFSDYVTNCKWKHTISSTTLMPNLTFYTSLKHRKTILRLSSVFRGCRDVALELCWLKRYSSQD